MFGRDNIIVTGHLTRTVLLLAIILGCVYSQDTSTQGLNLRLLEVGTSPVSVGVQQRRSINLVEGRSYNISCTREGGFGTATSVWFKSNVAITSNTGAQVYAIMLDTNNWILVLKMFRASDVGSYTCKGTNSNVTLDIGTSNPTVIASTPQLFVSSRVVQGSRATLQAFVSGTPPPTDSDITWYFNNQSIPDGSLIDGTDLLLPRTPLPSHSGTYTIQVTTTMGTARDSFVVTVTAQPSPSISPVDNQVRVNGTAITLTCQDSQGVPAPTFSWTRDGSSLVNDRTTITSMIEGSVTLSTLTINPLLPGDTGMYGCVAENSDGSSSAFVRVDVHFKPILEPFSTQLHWVIGSTATLQTLLYAAIPNNTITFYWTNPSSAVIDSSQYTNTPVNSSTVYGLVLSNLEREDGGIYTCVVQNNIGTSTLTFDLFITVPPVLEHIDGSPMRRIMLARNGASQVMLVVNVKEAIPNITASQVSWRKGNVPVEQSAKYITTARSSQVNLTITSLAMSDSGLYTVTIVHEAGTVSLEFQLEVLDPPAPPTLLWVTPVTACTAEIIWDRNRTQPTTTAIPSYIVIEASFSRDTSAEWVQVGIATISETSLTWRIPLGGLNTSYWLRARSGNTSVGEGENYLDPDTFYAYTEEMFPTLSSLNGEPSSDSQTIRVQWSLLPQQDCFSPSFNVLCTPLEVPGTSGQNRVTQDLRFALVRNLTSNTFYNCSVTVNFDGFGVSNKSYANNAIVTFPPRPSPPGVKPLGSVKPTSQTITVLFDLPLDHERISHYRVYAICLSDRSLPSVNTNNLYKTEDDSRLSTYEAVNQLNPFDENTPPFLGYIAAEVGAEEFEPLFTIGDGSRTDVAEFPNKELRPSSLYTFFLRAYPKTRGDAPSRSKRQDGSPSRQYVVFSSSVFSDIFTTEPTAEGGNSATLVGAIVAIVAILVILTGIVIVLVVCILYTKIRSSKRENALPTNIESQSALHTEVVQGPDPAILNTTEPLNHEYETLNDYEKPHQYEAILHVPISTKHNKSTDNFNMTDCSAYGTVSSTR